MWRKLWNDSDWAIIICTFLLVCIGLAAIGSATHVNQEPIGFGSLVVKQLIFFLANAAVVIGMQFLNYHRLKDWGNIIYGITLLMLIAVMAVGTSALGAQRWIQLGPITIQPSEFSKLLMIICMAKMLEPRIGKLDTFKSLILPVLYVGVPIALVFLQPDLGTSLVYIAIFVGMLFISGIRTRLIKIIAGTGLLLMPLGWFVLKEYQKQRILVFLNPDIDPFGSGYHIIQSKIAIGSGLIFGKGIFNGTQSQLNFLPENHTDFIFSVIGEEFGFVGCIITGAVFSYIVGIPWWMGIHVGMISGILAPLGDLFESNVYEGAAHFAAGAVHVVADGHLDGGQFAVQYRGQHLCLQNQ